MGSKQSNDRRPKSEPEPKADEDTLSPDLLALLLARLLDKVSDEKKKASNSESERQKRMVTENDTLYQLFEEKSFLGQGGFGVVVKGKHYMDRAWYAIKVIGFDKEELGRVIREVRALASLPTHPHIVAYKCCWVENVAKISDDGLKKRLLKVKEGRDLPDLILCVRLEYCEGNLADYVNHRNNEFFRHDEFRSQRNLRDDRNFTDQGYQNYKAIFVDILKGLSFLHKRNIIHRDIKPANVLYDKEMEFKITDFGFAKYYDPNAYMSRCVGTMCYAAPEQLQMKRYGLAADIYPLGLILFELMYPIRTKEEFQSLFEDLRTDQKVPNGLRTVYPAITKLIVQMLEQEPEQRISLDRLMDINWRDL